MRLAAALALALLLAGCASEPAAPTPATATSAPPTGPAPSPAPSPVPFVGVRLTVVGPPDPVRSGDEVVFRIILENREASALWTDPTFACSGTWDLQLYDEEDVRIRIDDRDAMGCPSGGPLEREVAPGADAVAEYEWDGQARPEPGRKAPLAPGEYRVEARAAYGRAPEGPADEARHANTTLVVT